MFVCNILLMQVLHCLAPTAEAMNSFICSMVSCIGVRKEQKSCKRDQKAGLQALRFAIWEDSTCLRWPGHFVCYKT